MLTFTTITANNWVPAFYFQYKVSQIEAGIWYFTVFDQAKLHKENVQFSEQQSTCHPKIN